MLLVMERMHSMRKDLKRLTAENKINAEHLASIYQQFVAESKTRSAENTPDPKSQTKSSGKKEGFVIRESRTSATPAAALSCYGRQTSNPFLLAVPSFGECSPADN